MAQTSSRSEASWDHNSGRVTAESLKLAEERDRLTSFQIDCPLCESKQVQLIDISKPSTWRCRDCNVTFVCDL